MGWRANWLGGCYVTATEDRSEPWFRGTLWPLAEIVFVFTRGKRRGRRKRRGERGWGRKGGLEDEGREGGREGGALPADSPKLIAPGWG